MNAEDRIARAGKLLCVESGEYSDYNVTGFFVVLRDFDPAAELESFLVAHPEQRKRYSFHGQEYLAVLLATGLLLEIEYATLYLESYGDPNEFRFTPTCRATDLPKD